MKTINSASYAKLIVLANVVSAKMTAAIATFATPTPALVDLDTAATTLIDAAQVTRLKRNRCSAVQTLAARAAANDVRVLLQQLLQYSVNTVLDLFPANSPQFNATLATAGFAMKNIRKPKHMRIATYIRQDNNKKHGAPEMWLNWKRPTHLIKGAAIAGYLIHWADIKSPGSPPTIEQFLMATTKTTANLYPFFGGPTSLPARGYIIPFNSLGQGQPIFFSMNKVV